jgi:phage tail sheath protein FI
MSETFLHGVKLLEVDTGARPIRAVPSSVIGLVGSGLSDEAAAAVNIGTANAALRYIAKPEQGATANAITIEAVNPGTNNAALAVAVTGSAITISLATGGTGLATSTASQVLAAINAFPAASALIIAELAPTSTGASVYAAHAATPLTGGADASFPLDVPVLVTSPSMIEKAGENTYLGKALAAIFKQAGAVVAVVRTASVSGSAGAFTGVYALKKAQTTIGFTPRIIVAENAATHITDVKSVCASCRAIAFVGIPTATAATATAATTFINANGNERIMALWPFVNGGEDPAPYAAGALAKSDNDRGFWWSPSNTEIFGINSLDHPVDFALGDTTSLANILNQGSVTTFIRQSGFRLWGNMTKSVDPKWQFLSVRRTADIINDSILENHLWAVDRNITKTYLEDVSDGVNAFLKDLTAKGAILGGRCWADDTLNTPANIAQGKVYFSFDFTPPYPAQTVTFTSILTNDYLTELTA